MNSDKGKKRRTQFTGYREGLGMIGANGVSVSVSNGDGVEQEISTTGVVGLLLDSANDLVNMLVPVPKDLNPTKPVGVRVVYVTGSSTAADTIEWIVLHDVITEGAAIAVGATALNTVIGEETVTGTANALEISSGGVINGGVVTEAEVANSLSMWSFLVELQAFAAGLGEDKFFMGLLLDYVPKDYLGPTWTQNPLLTEE